MMFVTWYNAAAMTKASGPHVRANGPGVTAGNTSAEPSTQCSMLLLTRLAKQVVRRSNEERLGIHIRLLMALSYLRDHDGAPQQEMAEAVCMDANNLVLLLNELEDLGYVVRRRDPEDRRRHRVHVTDAGREALSGAEHAEAEIEDDVLRALDAQERATLWRLLRRALQGAEQGAGHGTDEGADHGTDQGAGHRDESDSGHRDEPALSAGALAGEPRLQAR